MRRKRVKTRTIAVGTIVENEQLLETPSVLPTSQPADPQLTITVTEGMIFPCVGHHDVGLQTGLYCQVIFGKVVGASANVYVTAVVNGVTIINQTVLGMTSSSILQGCCQFIVPAKTGDVVTIKAYQSVASQVSLYGVRHMLVPLGWASTAIRKREFSVLSVKVVAGGYYNTTQIGRAINAANNSLTVRRIAGGYDTSGNVYLFEYTTATISANYAYMGAPMSPKHVADAMIKMIMTASTATSTAYDPATTLYVLKQYIPTKITIRYWD